MSEAFLRDPEADAVLIEARGLCKTYAVGETEVRALVDVDVTIGQGEYIALQGSSGSGKSTLMNILGCLDRPSAGSYTLAGTEVASLQRDELAAVRQRFIGFVFQSFHLVPRLSARDNVALPLVYAGVPSVSRRARSEQALARVGLADRARHLPNQLSGGQRQRVAIARAMIVEPALILADEPTGNLDSQTAEEIMKLLEQLHGQGTTIVVVTHSASVAERAGRSIHLHDGRVAAA